MRKVFVSIVALLVFTSWSATTYLPIYNVVNSGASATEFITGETLGSLRNNFDGEVGFNMTVGGSNITVTHLARWVVSGNSGIHTVRIRNSSCVQVASVSVDTSGATVGFKYVALASPVTLSAGGVYYVTSEEVNPGDQWYDHDTTVTTTAVATVDGNTFYNGSCNGNASANTTYVLVNFKYSSP